MRTSFASALAGEFVGTALLVGITTGVLVGAVRLGGIPLPAMALVSALAVLLPILLFVRISGAHLNPAITLALALSRRFDRSRAPGYVLAQFTGAFLGNGVVLLALGDEAHLGATVPSTGNDLLILLAELLFTSLLIGAVFVLTDHQALLGRWGLVLPPAAVGAATYFIGPLTGSSLNPARTLAPAVLSGTFTDLWVYLLAVILAAVAMALVWRPGRASG